ncbi:MAG: methyltransferase family protein [Planctomycetota bacterium]|jgi:protein-S-isoprenylcysteine O-methyltransferase Ste14
MPSEIFSPRQLLAYATVITVFFLADPQMPTFIAGCLVAALGVGMRVWGCGHLRKNKDLITTGPYAHVKHPLYLGTFLVSCGGIIAAGSPETPALYIWTILGPCFLISFFGFYLPKKKRIEGGRLEAKFGDRFPEYNRSVPDFVPSLRGYPSKEKVKWSYRQYRDNTELEMDLFIAAMFALVFFMPSII